jgi:aspartyl-tRNA(Asn)/glutamyl-tRNA(Gln) amidotransferase subunit A
MDSLKQDVKGLKIGVVKELMGEGTQPEVKEAIENALETYKSLGAEIVEVSIPHVKYSIGVYYILADTLGAKLIPLAA